MHDVLFYVFSVMTLAAAILVVTNRNAVNSAMFLIVSFFGMAALFVLLQAYFLAVIQVLVYAGAVVVLFLFIIMLLDVRGGDRAKFRAFTAVASFLALAVLVVAVLALFRSGSLPSPALSDGPAVGASMKSFGFALFTRYLLPMQVTGFLLLVAMLGVIVLSRRLEQGRTPSAAASRPDARA